MAIKALIGLALVAAITFGVMAPVRHGASQAEAGSPPPGAELNRG